MYRGIFWAVFSWEIVYLYLCFRTLVEDFSHFWELFLLGSQYCLERVQRRCYGNCFGKEIKFNLIYCTLTKTFPGIPGEILVKFAKFEFQMHRRFFRGNCVSSANKSQINYFSGFFGAKHFLARMSRQKHQNWIFHVGTNVLVKAVWVEIFVIFSLFLDFERKNFRFLSNFPNGLSKLF